MYNASYIGSGVSYKSYMGYNGYTEIRIEGCSEYTELRENIRNDAYRGIHEMHSHTSTFLHLSVYKIIIGSFLGAVFLVIQWMQARQYIQGQVDWNRVGNDIMAWFQSLSAQVYSWHLFGTLRIPATNGLAKGLVAGLAKS